MAHQTQTKNRNLQAAKTAKEDEFYTRLEDIERELSHYKAHFAGKTVYLNCDDPRESNFFRYFWLKFHDLGLKRLIATSFAGGVNGEAVWYDYEGARLGQDALDPSLIETKPLGGDGDFRSAESVNLLRQADIVVTNPPFSLFREYVAQLVEHEKQFLIVGNQNAITYQTIFRLIEGGRLWLGNHSGDMKFKVPAHYEARATRFWIDEHGQKWRSLGNACWFTNLDHGKRHEDLILHREFNSLDYPAYDNYEAIDVSRTSEIPVDFDGVMGVPITFLDKFSPGQFDIVGVTQSWYGAASKTYPRQVQVDANGRRSNVTKLNDGAAIRMSSPPVGKTYYEVDGEIYTKVYARVLIQRKRG